MSSGLCQSLISANPNVSEEDRVKTVVVQYETKPDRADEKTIFLPSGENWGSRSIWVEAISFLGTAVFSAEFGPGICQMLESTTSCS
jgi:hypothetical protein